MIDTLYNSFVRLDQWTYKKGLRQIYRPRSFTISVGNLSLGGTGKTPIVLWLIKALLKKKENLKIAVVSRNYKVQKSELAFPCEVILKDKFSALDYGDEAYLIKNGYPDVQVWVGPNKAKTAEALEKKYGQFDILIIDDGFQHWGLARDFDLVLLDPSDQKAFEVFPVGSARESWSGLKRADAFLLTKTNWCLDENLRKTLSQIPNQVPRWQAKFFMNWPDISDAEKIGVFCGVAQSKLFLQMAQKKYFSKIKKTWFFADHYGYSKKDKEEFLHFLTQDPHHVLLTTAKDAIKILESHRDGNHERNKDSRLNTHLRIVGLDVEIEHGEELIETLWSLACKNC